MSNYKGDEGFVSYATSTDRCMEVLSWSWTGANVGVIEDTVKGDSNRTYKGGRADGGSVQLRVQLDYDDTVQAAWIDSVIAGTGAAVPVELIVATGKEFEVNMIPTGVDVESPDGEGITTATLSGKITGLPNIPAW